MSDSHWEDVDGVIERGHKVASGAASDSPYPDGTIEMQVPFFKELGLDLTGFFKGTLNVSISPKTLRIVKPQFTFRSIAWTDKHPPEDFSFSWCRVVFKNEKYNALIYYPHPETKVRHFQNPSIMEIIAPPISDIEYGQKIIVEYNSLEITVSEANV